MPYLYEDGKDYFKCESCKKIKVWYNFPFIKYSSSRGKQCFKCIELRSVIGIKKLIRMATEHNMVGLRERLFECIDGLRAKTITAAEAKSICEVAQVIINTAKVEIEYFKAIGSKKASSFMEIENKDYENKD